jgi:hypothetical protein
VFAHHFWHCYNRLQATATPELGLPPFFYFITLLALRVFHQERVDVAVMEVGLGGRWDATNMVPSPAVCGVTSLGYDHMEVLGHTLTLIAGEKAGIIKAGVPCVTTQQPEEAAAVLQRTAAELQARGRSALLQRPFRVTDGMPPSPGAPAARPGAGRLHAPGRPRAAGACRRTPAPQRGHGHPAVPPVGAPRQARLRRER